MSKTALIFGASGVTSNFQRLGIRQRNPPRLPKKGTWKKVHALTNRPLKQSDSLWPVDERLNIVSGIDLLKGSQEELNATIKEQVKAYKASPDLTQELNDAVSMFQRSTTSIDKLSAALEFLVLQTGAKMYGCHLLDAHPTDYLQVPHKESQPRLKPPHHDTLFYHPQLDFLTSFAATKSWNWIDTRPDIIIGFMPNENFYSLANSLGFYLALFREVEGKGTKCRYPGSWAAWKAKSQDSSSDMIARQTLHLSLTLPASVAKGEGFNVADYEDPLTWEVKWPVICSCFGLIGTPPPDPTKGEGDPNEVRTYIKENIGVWENVEKREGLRGGLADSERVFKGFEYFLLTLFDFDRQYDMGKVYGDVGAFKEERGPAESWGGVFERMRKAKMIPRYYED